MFQLGEKDDSKAVAKDDYYSPAFIVYDYYYPTPFLHDEYSPAPVV